MAENSSKSHFTSFWKRAMDKTPPKEFVFLPPNETGGKNDHGTVYNGPPDIASKQLRRLQVREAQNKHRERKKNYVKHLEQDVIDLRKLIANTEAESESLQSENNNIKTILGNGYVLTSNVPVTQSDQSQVVLGSTWPLPVPSLEQPPSNQDQSSVLGMSVTIDFDRTINASCLQAYHTSTKGPQVSINTPTMFNFPTEAFTQKPAGLHRNFSKNGPGGPFQSTIPLAVRLAEIAINFILALEHPCRTHFHPIASNFDPKGASSGHELMASTSLYANAPSYVFAHPSDVAWDIPSSPVTELQKLREMNESLPKRDADITPVQAWFLLVEKYDMGDLVGAENGNGNGRGRVQMDGGFLEQLKGELSTLVECFAFGAVMDRLLFWEVVGQLGPNRI